jgi:hypothetical protein
MSAFGFGQPGVESGKVGAYSPVSLAGISL